MSIPLRRTVWTPCCKHPQKTRKRKGEIIMCTECHNPFVEPKSAN